MEEIKLIELKESHAQSLLRHAYAENEELISQIKEIQSKIDDNQELIDLLEGKSSNGYGIRLQAKPVDENGSSDEVYDSDWSIVKKVIHVIKESEKNLLAGEIVDGIIEKEPEAYPDEESKRKLSVSVYAALNGKTKSGYLSRRGSAKGFRYQLRT